MLKPTYSFRGVSLTQLAIPYVDNWLRTRQSVSDTVKQFSVSGVRMDLQQSLLPGAGTTLDYRAQLLNLYRDNRNLLLLDKATEEFFQINTPLAGLDALQAQAQEQMSAVSRAPLVKLLGITPSGLNASSDGEIRVWYDYVHGYQDGSLTPLMTVVLKLIQLSLFGVIDEDITWQWEKLHEATEVEQADIERAQMETDRGYIEAGVITPEQAAKTLSADPTSRYSGIADGGDLESLPDDDIEGITDAILQIQAPVGDAPPAAPAAPTGAGLPAGAQTGVANPAEV
jgi:phage-related protein (TIGR01555 family)